MPFYGIITQARAPNAFNSDFVSKMNVNSFTFFGSGVFLFLKLNYGDNKIG